MVAIDQATRPAAAAFHDPRRRAGPQRIVNMSTEAPRTGVAPAAIRGHVKALRTAIDERRNWTDEQRQDDLRIVRWIRHVGADVLPMAVSDCPWLLEGHKPSPRTIDDWLPDHWLDGEPSPEKRACILWAVVAVFAPAAAPDWSDLTLPIEEPPAQFDFSDAEDTAEGRQFAESWRRQHGICEPTVQLQECDFPAPVWPVAAVLRDEVEDHCDVLRWRGVQRRATPEIVELALFDASLRRRGLCGGEGGRRGGWAEKSPQAVVEGRQEGFATGASR